LLLSATCSDRNVQRFVTMLSALFVKALFGLTLLPQSVLPNKVYVLSLKRPARGPFSFQTPSNHTRNNMLQYGSDLK